MEAPVSVAHHEELRGACLAAAEAALRWEIRLDSRRSMMPPGHNGPYQQAETPVRNTAHWLVTFSLAYAWTGATSFRETGLRLSSFLRDPGPIRTRHALIHRQAGGDRCNGVIGPAWVIDGLSHAALHLGDDEAAAQAVAELEGLPFDERPKAWRRVDPVAGEGAVDYTYNHQAWLAAAAAAVPGGKGAVRAERFLDGSASGSLRIHADGIAHHILHAATVRGRLLVGRFAALRMRRPAAIEAKEAGYHLYVLFPLIRLWARFPEHPLFEAPDFRRAVMRGCDSSFLNTLDENPFAYPYNAPGFELPILGVVGLDPGLAREVYERQRQRTWDSTSGLHSRGSPDPATLAARIFELAIAVEVLT
jgi:hypothetical protein